MKVKEIELTDISFVEQMLYVARYDSSGNNETVEVPEFETVRSEPGFQRYVERWGRSGDAGFIAQERDDLIGASWYRRFDERKLQSGPSHIVALGVAKEYRGMGVGTQLMKSLIERALADDIEQLGLSVRKTNLVAQNLYISMGFDFLPVEDETVRFMSLAVK